MQTNLTQDELRQYQRQCLLPGVGVHGQSRLKAARVLIVGVGGLGSPSALYLAAAGVGTIGLVDFDQVELSNLHRQILYTPDHVSQQKVQVAAQDITQKNPHVQVHCYPLRIDQSVAASLVANYDIVIDGTDSLTARSWLAEACYLAGKPYVFGAVYQHEGQLAVFLRDRGPCYHCLFPKGNEGDLAVATCQVAGVLGVVPGVVGMMQATFALHLILGFDDVPVGQLFLYESRPMSMRRVKISRDPHCSVCGEISAFAEPRIAAPVQKSAAPSISMQQLQDVLKQRGPSCVLIDVRTQVEYEVFHLPNSLLMPWPDTVSFVSKLSLSYDQELIVYCASGVRSQLAWFALQQQGFTNVKTLDGGIDAFIS